MVGPEWVIPLFVQKRNRVGDIILALIVLLVGLLFVAIFGALTIGVFQNTGGYIGGGFFALLGIAVIATTYRTIAWSAKPRAHIRLLPDALEIDHHLRFRRPFRIPKERIAAVVVDVIHVPSPDLGDMVRTATTENRKVRPRLPIIGIDRLDPAVRRATSMSSFLYSKGNSPLPLVLSTMGEAPNLAVVFDEPLVMNTARRPGLAGSKGWLESVGLIGMRVPSASHPSKGFLARVVDPHQAFMTFDAWGILPTSEADARAVVHVFPTAAERAAEHRARARRWVAFVVAIVVIRILGEVTA